MGEYSLSRFWNSSGRFLKIYEHIFMIFELKFELWFWSRRHMERKREGFFHSNFKVLK